MAFHIHRAGNSVQQAWNQAGLQTASGHALELFDHTAGCLHTFQAISPQVIDEPRGVMDYFQEDVAGITSN